TASPSSSRPRRPRAAPSPPLHGERSSPTCPPSGGRSGSSSSTSPPQSSSGSICEGPREVGHRRVPSACVIPSSSVYAARTVAGRDEAAREEDLARRAAALARRDQPALTRFERRTKPPPSARTSTPASPQAVAAAPAVTLQGRYSKRTRWVPGGAGPPRKRGVVG